MCLITRNPIKVRKNIFPILVYKYVNTLDHDKSRFKGPWYTGDDSRFGVVLYARDMSTPFQDLIKDPQSIDLSQRPPIKHIDVRISKSVVLSWTTTPKHYVVDAGYHAYRMNKKYPKKYHGGILPGQRKYAIIPPFSEYTCVDPHEHIDDIVATRMIVCKNTAQMVWCYLLSLLGLNKRSNLKK